MDCITDLKYVFYKEKKEEEQKERESQLWKMEAKEKKKDK